MVAAEMDVRDRKPPTDERAEMAVLGCILLNPDLCDEVAMRLKPGDFYNTAAEATYRHMLRLRSEKSGFLDETLVLSSMKKAKEQVSPVFLVECMELATTPAYVTSYVDSVERASTLRAVRRAGEQMVRDAHECRDDANEVLARAESSLFSILEGQHSLEACSIGDALGAALDELNARRGGKVSGVRTGFPDLDKLCGGLHKGELAILAARPSMGKSALALNIAESVARDEPVMFASLEMSRLELTERLLFSIAKVDSYKGRNGTMTPEDHQKVARASSKVSVLSMTLDDAPARTCVEIMAQCRRMKRKGLGLLVVDYLQLIRPEDSREPRQEQVALISRRLKGIARELDIPVLCLAQLNRQNEQGADKRPKLSHLRESGAIEQDADQVWFVHRDDYYRDPKEVEDGLADVIVAKNRNGQTGNVKLCWQKQFMRFESYIDRVGGYDASRDEDMLEYDG